MASLRSRFAALLSCVVAVGTAAACSSATEDVESDAGTSSSSSSSSGDTTSSSSGESSSGRTNDAYAEAPVLQQIEPSSAFVGTAGPTVVVRGKNFVPRTIVQLDGAALETSFIDTTELRATLPTERLAVPGVLVLTVGTSPPGGGASASLDFTVENPAPTLTRVSDPDPPSVAMGSPARTIQLEGASFVTGAKVRWAGAELPTTLIDATHLSAEVDAARFVDSGIYELDVVNPAPGGGTSAKLTFVVSNPTVQLSAVEPNSTTVGAGDLLLTLTGSGFVAGKSKVAFSSTELVPTVLSDTSMTVTVPAAQFQAVGTKSIAVRNPNPGGGLSDGQIFSVVNPVPSMTSLSPDAVTQGAGATEVTVNGRDFVATTKVTVDNVPVSPVFVDAANKLRFTIPMSKLGVGGTTLDIRVENPGPGGGTSTLPFSVRNNATSLGSVVVENQLESDGIVAGQAVTLALNGTGYLASSKAHLNGAQIDTLVVSPTKITVTVTPGAAGALAFKIVTPAAPDSNTITVSACALTAGAQGLPGTDIVLNAAPPFAGGPVTLFGGSSGKTCGAGVTFRAVPAAPNNGPNVSAYIVQNTSGKDASLEAFASCSGALNDAYLALYRRTTIPTTDAERAACDGVISNGITTGGVAPYTSNKPYTSLTTSNTGNSRWCPGLTIDNGGAPVIHACETMVAYLQTDRTTAGHGPPQGFTMNLWPLP